MVSYSNLVNWFAVGSIVLILIVVEDGLVHVSNVIEMDYMFSLNPYCSGRWSRTSYK